MKKVNLNKGYEAIVDDLDYEKVKNITWYVVKKNKNIYARTTIYVGGKQKYKTLMMHRFLLALSNSKLLTDHINGNGLDNRRNNLRICSFEQNQQNRRKHSKNTYSIYKGVTYLKYDKKWSARIYFKGKRYTLGRFMTEKEAAIAYNNKARELQGEFACLNKIK